MLIRSGLVAISIAGLACGGAPYPQMQLAADALPDQTTNAVANSSAAALLGQQLFFDKGMSADGKVSCASCHDSTQGFSDPKAVSQGAFGGTGSRHSMPLGATPLQSFLFWDGRADSLWSQPLKAIEGAVEMDFSRVEVARRLTTVYAASYQSVFGAAPDLGVLPTRAQPGMAAWDAMTAAQQDAVQRVFANTGKALEAYERKLVCADTRFDQWARGALTLSAAESDGADRFDAIGCTQCHSGRAFSDGQFHNLGLASATGATDVGRQAAAALLAADPFNGAGKYSDDPARGAALLANLAQEQNTLGAFRTASLRGAGQRPRFGHAGRFTDLGAFINDTYRDPHLHAGAVGALDPKLRRIDVHDDDVAPLVAFLHTLDCNATPAALLQP